MGALVPRGGSRDEGRDPASYRGSGPGAAKCFEEGHGRAEASTARATGMAEVDAWRARERLSSRVLEGRGELEAVGERP